MLNQVAIQGRIGTDIALKATPNGTAVLTFPLAVQKKFKDESGQHPTIWVNCVAWRQNAEFISRNFRKGNLIIVTGSLDVRQYDAHGETRTVTEVVVDSVEFTGEKAEPEQ